MMKWIMSIVGLSIWVSATVPSVQAREILQSPSVCTIAISSTVKKLDEVPKITSVHFRTYPLGGYLGRPMDKTSAYHFAFSGTGGDDILRSPILMKKLASQLMHDCNEPGTVTFGLDQSDAFAVYGVVNGRVRAFNCYESTGFPRQMPWGQRICL